MKISIRARPDGLLLQGSSLPAELTWYAVVFALRGRGSLPKPALAHIRIPARLSESRFFYLPHAGSANRHRDQDAHSLGPKQKFGQQPSPRFRQKVYHFRLACSCWR